VDLPLARLGASAAAVYQSPRIADVCLLHKSDVKADLPGAQFLACHGSMQSEEDNTSLSNARSSILYTTVYVSLLLAAVALALFGDGERAHTTQRLLTFTRVLPPRRQGQMTLQRQHNQNQVKVEHHARNMVSG
jgi:hypothetical protein